MTIKARTAAATMMAELEAETDALRDSIKEELRFSLDVINVLTESGESELRALDAEMEKRRAALKQRYGELIRNEERRIALCRERLEKLDGPDVSVTSEDAMLGHNSDGVAEAQP
jgi:hypothetical protein